MATSLQLSQSETNSVEQHNPRETTVTALQQKSSNTRRDTSLEYAHDVSPPPTKHAPVTSVKLDVLVGDEKENVCVSLSCSILPVIEDRSENKHVDADLASCCLLAANQPRSAVRVLHENGSIITLDTAPGSQHSSSSPTEPRRTVQDDDSIDDLLPRHMSGSSSPTKPRRTVQDDDSIDDLLPRHMSGSSSPTKPRRTVQDDDSIDDLLPRHMSGSSSPTKPRRTVQDDDLLPRHMSGSSSPTKPIRTVQDDDSIDDLIPRHMSGSSSSTKPRRTVQDDDSIDDLLPRHMSGSSSPTKPRRTVQDDDSIDDLLPRHMSGSSSPTKPRRTVQDDDSIDDLLPRHISVISKPVSSKLNKYSDTRKLDSADIQRVNSLCELRDTSNIVHSGSPREGTNGDVVDDVCDMLCSDSLQFTDSSDSSLFQRDECEFNRCDTDWSYCLHNKPCQNGLHSCHSDRQGENTLHCCHSNKPGEFGLHCYYGDATPSFHTESSPQFSCEISDHSPSDNPRIELLGGEHKAECSSLSKFVIEDTITFTDESESFAN